MGSTANANDFLDFSGSEKSKNTLHFRFGIPDFFDPLLSAKENAAVRKSLLAGPRVVVKATYKKSQSCGRKLVPGPVGSSCWDFRETTTVPHQIETTAEGDAELRFEVARVFPKDGGYRFDTLWVDLNAEDYNRTAPIRKLFALAKKRRDASGSAAEIDPPDPTMTLRFSVEPKPRKGSGVGSGHQTVCFSLDLPVQSPIYHYDTPGVVKLVWDDPSLSFVGEASGARCADGHGHDGRPLGYQGLQTPSPTLPKELIERAKERLERNKEPRDTQGF